MPIYNKLVRDFIPAIIEADGKSCTTRTLNEKEYKNALKTKLTEEVDECLQAEDRAEVVEELADILELIHALAEVNGSSFSEVERVRKEKAEKRGGFSDAIYLIEVKDD